MSIFYHETSQEFHLKNESVSYIMKVLKNGQIGQLYYGSAIPDKEDFGYYIETMHRPMSSYLFEGNLTYSLEHLKQEYPFLFLSETLAYRVFGIFRFFSQLVIDRYKR